MIIEVIDESSGIHEKFSTASLNFIKNSYPDFADKELTEEDYKALALKMVQSKYKDSRFENANWQVTVS